MFSFMLIDTDKYNKFSLTFYIISILILSVIFIREFFKQKAQYTIKSILILTFCTAVTCSIYLYTGFGGLRYTLFVVYVLLFIYAESLRECK
jgi:hypothetical protein